MIRDIKSEMVTGVKVKHSANIFEMEKIIIWQYFWDPNKTYLVTPRYWDVLWPNVSRDFLGTSSPPPLSDLECPLFLLSATGFTARESDWSWPPPSLPPIFGGVCLSQDLNWEMAAPSKGDDEYWWHWSDCEQPPLRITPPFSPPPPPSW